VNVEEARASAGERARRRELLRAARRWAPVFGADPAGCDLRGFELVVLDGVGDREPGSAPTPALIAALRQHAVVLGYLSVGTLEGWRPYASRAPVAWTLEALDDWPDEAYVDVRHDGWQQLMAEQAVALQAAGFDGLYLDNLDVVEDHPALADAMAALVRGLRAAAPRLLIVGQNGLFIADRLPLDAIAHEDVFWRWDEDRQSYRRSPARETRALVDGLRQLRAAGLPVFTLDYAPPGSEGAQEALERSLAEGFRPAVSVLELDRVPHLAAPAGVGG
jgi:cysteinyl-tRNA synthetase